MSKYELLPAQLLHEGTLTQDLPETPPENTGSTEELKVTLPTIGEYASCGATGDVAIGRYATSSVYYGLSCFAKG